MGSPPVLCHINIESHIAQKGSEVLGRTCLKIYLSEFYMRENLCARRYITTRDGLSPPRLLFLFYRKWGSISFLSSVVAEPASPILFSLEMHFTHSLFLSFPSLSLEYCIFWDKNFGERRGIFIRTNISQNLELLPRQQPSNASMYLFYYARKTRVFTIKRFVLLSRCHNMQSNYACGVCI